MFEVQIAFCVMVLNISAILSVTTITSGERDWEFFVAYINRSLGFQQFLYPAKQPFGDCAEVPRVLVVLYLWDGISSFSKPPANSPKLSTFSRRDRGYRYHVPVMLADMKIASPSERKRFLLDHFRTAVVRALEKSQVPSDSPCARRAMDDFEVFSRSYLDLPMPKE